MSMKNMKLRKYLENQIYPTICFILQIRQQDYISSPALNLSIMVLETISYYPGGGYSGGGSSEWWFRSKYPTCSRS
ncbi:hypothetical protein CS542_06980 [Pedobacter sp. IW39]|nr:hypothetical protein CS542_06980 [Pedobacter sp. IW39]